MGLLRRLLSLGSKKEKEKKKRPIITHNVPVEDARVRQQDDEEHEAAVGRLLRSSSARYAVVREFDYNTLPPLPHPINSVIQPPTSSAVSIASSTISNKGTYTVTVHGRKRHASTEFPNANPGLGVERIVTRRPCASTPPEDSSRALRLRSDPSVLSLVDMYDEHGRLPSKAFSNSPPATPKEGKAQCKRSGSTLRQLLGAPDSLNSRDGNEGDISWAERFLGENKSSSSLSSAGLPTPITPDTPSFNNSLPRPSFAHDITISTDNDNSGAFDYPVISSMDVELSLTSETSALIIDTIKEEEPPKSINPVTPTRRASQVFGFLTERRRSKNLPDPPSVFSSPSESGCSQHDLRSQFSDTSSECRASPPTGKSATPYSSDTHRISHRISTSSISRPMPLGKRSSRTSLNSTSKHASRSRRDSIVPDITYDRAEDEDNEDPNIQTAQKVKVIMSGPTKVIVTAPTPSQTHVTPSRIPRGPRAPSRRSTSGGHRSKPVMLTERSNTTVSRHVARETNVSTPTSKRNSSASYKASSVLSENGRSLEGLTRRKAPTALKTGTENNADLGLSVKAEIPLTPLRTTGSASACSPLYRTAINRDMFKPPPGMTPSPSTSEMSPVGRQPMTDIRQQRLAAREVDRDKTSKYTRRTGSTRSVLHV